MRAHMAHIFIASYKKKANERAWYYLARSDQRQSVAATLGKQGLKWNLRENIWLVLALSLASLQSCEYTVTAGCLVAADMWSYCTALPHFEHTWKEQQLWKTQVDLGFFCFCFLTTRDFSSTAHLYGSNSNFPLKPVFFPHELFSSSFRVQERKGGGYMWKEEVDLHVSTSLQTERQAGWEAWGRGAL